MKDLRNKSLVLTAAVAVAVVAALPASANAAEVSWGCIPSTVDVFGKPLTQPVTYTARLLSVDNSVLLTPEIQCTNPVRVAVPDPPGLFYSVSVTAANAAGASLPSPGLRIGSLTETVEPPPPPPTTKILLTVGGDVFIASPNYTNFSFKLGGKAGTIVGAVKCDPTRKILPDFYRVTSPIVWTNGKKDYVVAKCEFR